MEGSSLDSVAEHVRSTSAWVTPSATDREAFNKAVETGQALPSRHRSEKSVGHGRTFEQSYAPTARVPDTSRKDEDRKVTVVAAQTIKPKTKKKYWCCGEAVED